LTVRKASSTSSFVIIVCCPLTLQGMLSGCCAAFSGRLPKLTIIYLQYDRDTDAAMMIDHTSIPPERARIFSPQAVGR
jgi:hypothetical protein